MRAIHLFLIKYTFYSRFVAYLKRKRIPIFRTQSYFDVLRFLVLEIEKQSNHSKASSLSYNFLLAIFPAMIFLFTLIPYVPIDGFQEKMMTMVSLLLPKETFMVVDDTLNDIVKNQRGGLLSFGFLFALFFATNGVQALMHAFNQYADLHQRRSFLRQRWKAIKLTFLIVFSLIMAISVMVIGDLFINIIETDLAFKHNQFWTYIILYLRWIAFIFFYWFTIALVYRYAPSQHIRWPLINIGAFMTTTLAVLTSVGFSTYINYFNTYNKVYGSIGTLIVVMIWLYLNSLIILLGFELNYKYFSERRKKRIEEKVVSSH